MLMESLAASSLADLYRLYNTIAKKYFPSDMPAVVKEVQIIVSPLQVQRIIGGAFYSGMDANGMTVSKNGMILLYVSPFLLRYPRLMYITMAHEMVHVYCHHKHKETGDGKWLDNHGERFHKVVSDLIGKGLVGVKPNQDIVELPHSYHVACGQVDGGYKFLRFESSSDITNSILVDFGHHCDTSKPLIIGEIRNSIVGVLPFVEHGEIIGEFFSYGPDPVFAMKEPTQYKWPSNK